MVLNLFGLQVNHLRGGWEAGHTPDGGMCVVALKNKSVQLLP